MAKKHNSSSKKLGRPTKRTERVVEQLERLFRLGVSDEVACRGAHIAKTSLYNWYEEDEDFLYRMRAAKDYARIAAASVVMESIIKGKNTQDAKWWLEKKHSEEFGGQANVQISDNRSINLYGSDEQLAERLLRLAARTQQKTTS